MQKQATLTACAPCFRPSSPTIQRWRALSPSVVAHMSSSVSHGACVRVRVRVCVCRHPSAAAWLTRHVSQLPFLRCWQLGLQHAQGGQRQRSNRLPVVVVLAGGASCEPRRGTVAVAERVSCLAAPEVTLCGMCRTSAWCSAPAGLISVSLSALWTEAMAPQMLGPPTSAVATPRYDLWLEECALPRRSICCTRPDVPQLVVGDSVAGVVV